MRRRRLRRFRFPLGPGICPWRPPELALLLWPELPELLERPEPPELALPLWPELLELLERPFLFDFLDLPDFPEPDPPEPRPLEPDPPEPRPLEPDPPEPDPPEPEPPRGPASPLVRGRTSAPGFVGVVSLSPGCTSSSRARKSSSRISGMLFRSACIALPRNS